MTTAEDILTKYPEAQINGEGQIALRCIREGQFLIVDCPSGREYVAVTQVGICLVWVYPQDVDFIMDNKKLGCCGQRKRAYFIADETHVRRWMNQGGR